MVSRFLLMNVILMVADSHAAGVPATEPGGETIMLRSAGVPGAERVHVEEALTERAPQGPLRDRIAEHVTRPLMTLFHPRGKPNGITLLIVPGGGYVRVVIDKEGFETAEWFAQRGFECAVPALPAAGRWLGRRRGRPGARRDARVAPVAPATDGKSKRAPGRHRILRGRSPRGAPDHRAATLLSAPGRGRRSVRRGRTSRSSCTR